MRLLMNHRLIESSDIIVAAVSGGIDSMVMLDQLNKLKDSFHLTLIVAHINHGIREASNEEYEFVRERAEAYGNLFEGLVIHEWPNSNFHEAARKRRYDFFLSIAEKYHATKIALAHQLDDQAETILMRLVRGTSFKGYSGIKSQIVQSNLTYIRPLLGVSRQAIIRYQLHHQLPYRNDASNDSDDYARNRYRHHILPLIAQENPNYLEKFEQFSTYIEEANSLIESISDEFIKQHAPIDETMVSFSIEAFNRCDRIVKRDILKHLMDRLTHDQIELSFNQSQQLLAIIEGTKPHGECSINQQYRAFRSYDLFTMEIFEPKEEIPLSLCIKKPGTYLFGKDSFELTPTLPNNNHGIYLELWYNNLDLILPLTIRLRQEGDRIQRHQGSKKLKDLFIDYKIPKSIRHTLPVVVDSTHTIRWIPGYFKSSHHQNGNSVIYLIYNRG